MMKVFLVLLAIASIGSAEPEVESRQTVQLILSSNGTEASKDVQMGTSVTIYCGRPSEHANIHSTVWLKDGQVMLQSDMQHVVFHIMHLYLSKVQLNDSGNYTCMQELRANDRNLTVTRQGVLTVHKPSNDVQQYDSGGQKVTRCSELSKTMDLKNTKENYLCFQAEKMSELVVRPAGQPLQLKCIVKGNPQPTVTWYVNGTKIEATSASGIVYQKFRKGNNLEVEFVTPSDAGKYTCEASNGYFKEEFAVEVDIVRKSSDKPFIVSDIGNITVIIGETATLNCTVHPNPKEDPDIAIFWSKGLGDDEEDVESRTTNVTLMRNLHYLVLENVTTEDEGWYACIARNSIGISVKEAYVKVQQEPELSVPIRENTSNHISEYVMMLTIPFFASIIGAAWYMYRKAVRINKANLQPASCTTIKQVFIEKRMEKSDAQAVVIPDVHIKKHVVPQYTDQEYEFPLDKRWEFPREQLEIGKHLGEGAFGEVKFGIANGILESGVLTKVAIKSLKQTHNDADMIDLISEMETMKELGQHKNIINLLGCCTQKGELLVIMEFAEHGNLRDYLRAHRQNFVCERSRPCTIIPIDTTDPSKLSAYEEDPLSFADLMSMAYQVARGMDYLAQRKYVHRDLAARNILVCSNKVVKIADFGMTRSTFTNDYYRKKKDGPVPVKWMAPETLFHKIYTTQSDVWSYGILLWEIVTLGGTPYPSMPDLTNLLEYLKSGRRMEQPAYCPTELYLIMRDCWVDSPTSRPSFSDLVEDVRRILHIASGTEYMDLEGVQPFDYGNFDTPPSSPEHSGSAIPFFDPEFLKSVSQS